MKIFDTPQMQQVVLNASEDVSHIPRHTAAMMLAIYFLSVTSLGNEDCEHMFGESRNSLLAKYSHATQQALVNARFLKSLNIVTLQALVMFLVSLSDHLVRQFFRGTERQVL